MFHNNGIHKTDNENEADFLVFNMCSVRQSAVDRVYGQINKKPKNPKIILTGCVSKKDKLKLSKKIDYILDIKALPDWPKILGIAGKELKNKLENYLSIAPQYSSDFSVNIPIMTGCNNFCAYCIVPYVRGREISRPAYEIIDEVKNAIKNGVKEVWLLGQNVNSYKGTWRLRLQTDLETESPSREIRFPELLKMVNELPGDFWIRFTSSHPKDFGDDLINAMAECEKLPKYLNLPLQAGSDKILKKMNRPYTKDKYIKLVEKIRAKMPDISISTDIIVGFPGETKKDFKDSCDIFSSIGFDMAYISEFSPRPGTAAEKMKDNVSKAEKSKRKNELNEILKITALKNNEKLIGTKQKVLVSDMLKGCAVGKTSGYKTVKFESTKNLQGKFVNVKITKATSWGLFGILEKS